MVTHQYVWRLLLNFIVGFGYNLGEKNNIINVNLSRVFILFMEIIIQGRDKDLK